MSQSSGSRRTSLTFLESSENGAKVDQDQSTHTHIAEIAARGEEHFERYGGDDIHEPPPKELNVGGASIALSESTIDENMVTWDGPNDPTNPQNWSIKYKWLVTVVLIILTFDAYVQLSVSFF
jgi:MFS transporter, DHA1 family, multidrug resistance protein